MNRWSKLILANTIAVFIALGLIGQIIIPFLKIEENNLRYLVLFLGVSATLQAVHWFIEQITGYTLRDLVPDEMSPKELEKEWRKQLRSKNPPELRDNIKKFYEQKMYEWVISYAKRLLEVRPNDIDALRYGGRALNKLERSKEALEFGKQLAYLNKIEHEGYETMADAYSDLGETQNAIKYYEIALNFAPESIKTTLHARLASEYSKAGQIGKALISQQIYTQSPLTKGDSYQQEKLERLERIQNRFGDVIETNLLEREITDEVTTQDAVINSHHAKYSKNE